MNGLDGEGALCYIETGDVFRESVILDKHGHEIPAGKKLHDQIQRLSILEGIKELYNPRRIRFCEDIALSADMS